MAELDDYLDEWAGHARHLSWDQPWDTVFDEEGAGGSWFTGATLNIADNCIDRHLPELRDTVAFYWEGEPGDRRAITYGDLCDEVTALAGALSEMGVCSGDRVALHMGMTPEWVVALLACARLGAVSSVLAVSLPPDSLSDRIEDLSPRVLITQDGSWRHGVILPLKSRADEALAAGHGVDHTLVVRRTGIDVDWYEGDRWYDDVIGSSPKERPARPVPSTHPLFISYVANRRGRPTGIVHGSGGFLTSASALYRIGLSSGRANEVLWCAIDNAWVAGPLALFGALACGATSVLYEGMLDTPTHARAWEMVQRYGVTSFLTTPSVARRLRSWEDALPGSFDLSSLKYVLTIGESLEPETRTWLYADVGSKKIIVGDGWGQTELGGVARIDDTCSGDPLPDAALDVVDESGASVSPGEMGELVLRRPWPGTLLGINGDDETEPSPHWDRYPGVYATRDWARREPDGALTLLGRMDRYVSVSGQLVSLTEVGEVLREHPFVRDVEILEGPGIGGGESFVACVTLVDEAVPGPDLARDLRAHLHEIVGGLARPRMVAFVEEFPVDVSSDDRRSALKGLCAAATDDPVQITASQLRTAALSQGSG